MSFSIACQLGNFFHTNLATLAIILMLGSHTSVFITSNKEIQHIKQTLPILSMLKNQSTSKKMEYCLVAHFYMPITTLFCNQLSFQ